MYSFRDQLISFVGSLAFLAICVVVFGLIALGTPATPWLIGGGLFYLWARHRSGLAFVAICDTLEPVLIGLSVATVWFWVVRVFAPTREQLALFEEWLTKIAIKLEEMSKIGPLGYGCILVGIALVGTLLRNGAVVRRSIAFKQLLDSASIVALTVASFTFFAQLPIEQKIRFDRDLQAKYRGWPKDKDLERIQRFLIMDLEKQVYQMRRPQAVDLRFLIDEVLKRETVSPYPELERRDSLVDMINFERIKLLSAGQSLVAQEEMPLRTLPDSNNDMLLAVNTSFCNFLAETTGKLLGSEENIAYRILKSLVELGSEKLMEEKFDPKSAERTALFNTVKVPLKVEFLLRPDLVDDENHFISPSPSRDAFSAILNDRIEINQIKEQGEGRPTIFGFGDYATREEMRIDEDIKIGRDPFEHNEAIRNGRDYFKSNKDAQRKIDPKAEP